MIARKCVGVAFAVALMICWASPFVLAEDPRDLTPISVTISCPMPNLCVVPNSHINLSGTAEDFDEVWAGCPSQWWPTQDNCSITSWTCPQGQGTIVAGQSGYEWYAPAGPKQCAITAHANDEGLPNYWNDPEGTAQRTTWSVDVGGLQYNTGQGGWTDVTFTPPDLINGDPFRIVRGSTVQFRAIRAPVGAPNWPIYGVLHYLHWGSWNGFTAGGQDGDDEASVQFNVPSASEVDWHSVCAGVYAMKSARLVVCDIQCVSPNYHDWLSDCEGRIIMGTLREDDTYYFKRKTTIGDTYAQVHGAPNVVTITAYVYPGLNTTVYFRLLDPDDASHYEPDPGGNDNRGAAGQLSATSAVAHNYRINDTWRYAAEVTLTFTDRYAGDNYLVQASVNPNFPDPYVVSLDPYVAYSWIRETSILTARKRIYVEHDEMFRQCSRLVQNYTPDEDALDNDPLHVQDGSLFHDGDHIEIISPSTSEDDKQYNYVIGPPNGNTLTVGDMNRSFSGDDVYVGLAPATGAYWRAPTGNIQGAFDDAYTEFVEVADGSDHVPLQDNQTSGNRHAFRDKWFKHKEESNYVYLCGADHSSTGELGWSLSDENYSFVYRGQHGMDAAAAETTVHELGHQFDLPDDHHIDVAPDDYVAHPNHVPDGLCIMDDKKYSFEGAVEFCIGCLYWIRDFPDGI